MGTAQSAPAKLEEIDFASASVQHFSEGYNSADEEFDEIDEELEMTEKERAARVDALRRMYHNEVSRTRNAPKERPQSQEAYGASNTAEIGVEKVLGPSSPSRVIFIETTPTYVSPLDSPPLHSSASPASAHRAHSTTSSPTRNKNVGASFIDEEFESAVPHGSVSCLNSPIKVLLSVLACSGSGLESSALMDPDGSSPDSQSL